LFGYDIKGNLNS